MRLIDADALTEKCGDWYVEEGTEEGFIGTLGQLLSIQPDTTTNDSIPAETGKNDGDGTSGDCISRQAAIDALKEKVFHNLSDEFYGAMQVLDELPSAQPERKTGHWILDRSGAYCCSNCMEPCASYVMMKPRDKFCKMCGAKMDWSE